MLRFRFVWPVAGVFFPCANGDELVPFVLISIGMPLPMQSVAYLSVSLSLLISFFSHPFRTLLSRVYVCVCVLPMSLIYLDSAPMPRVVLRHSPMYVCAVRWWLTGD